MVKIFGKVKLLPKKLKIFLIVICVLVIGLFIYQVAKPKTAKISYQTTIIEKGTLINSISASGAITSSGVMNITTSVSGIVKAVYVKEGQKITKGQKIAEIITDQSSAQKQASAWASYLSAKNSVESAKSTMYSLDSTMWSVNQKFINDAVMRGLSVNDPTYIQQHDDWLAAEMKYKNQQAVVDQAQASLNSAWYSYQQASPIIYAPMAGIITNLLIAPGIAVGTTDSSSTTSTGQAIGVVQSDSDNTLAVVNLSEIDSIGVKNEQKVTLTIDALPDKTYTGIVLFVNKSGTTSSGVTTYPTTIKFDNKVVDVNPGMAVSAEIITLIKNDIILIPSTAVTTNNDQSTVEVMKNGQPTTVAVELGLSNDSQTEITSGLTEGDLVITSTTSNQQLPTNNSQTSPFSGLSRTSGTSGNRTVIQGGAPLGF